MNSMSKDAYQRNILLVICTVLAIATIFLLFNFTFQHQEAKRANNSVEASPVADEDEVLGHDNDDVQRVVGVFKSRDIDRPLLGLDLVETGTVYHGQWLRTDRIELTTKVTKNVGFWSLRPGDLIVIRNGHPILVKVIVRDGRKTIKRLDYQPDPNIW